MTPRTQEARSTEQGFSQVPLPVDVTDKEQFPEIARAIEWARKQREQTT